MLNLILGRSGSGKTEFSRHILKSRAQLGDKRLLLIVPEQFSFASERALLSDLPADLAQNIEVLSFTRLCDFVGRELGGLAVNTIDDSVKIIVMMRTLEGLKDSLKLYAAHTDSTSLAKEFLSLIDELKKERITPDMLDAVSEKTASAALSLKLKECALIFRTYDAVLSQSYTDESTLSDMLCQKLECNDFFSGYTICIDAFKGFTGQEFEIIKHLLIQAAEVYITLPTDDIYANDPSMIFVSVNETAKRLISIAKENSITVRYTGEDETGEDEGFIKSGIRFKSEALAFLEKNIFSPCSETFDHETNDIVLVSANDIHDECMFVAATARKLLTEDGYRLNDIAVITRSEDEYKTELISTFKKFDLPVFEDKRQPVSAQPLITLCFSVLQIMTSGFTTENILRYLKCGLSPLSDIEVARLENYALMWDFGAKAWREDFTNSPAGLDELKSKSAIERNEKELADLNEMRKKTVLPLMALKNSLKEATASDISRALYKFILSTGVDSELKRFAIELNDDGNSDLAAEQDRVWDLLMNILSKLGSIHADTKTDIKTYTELFRAVIDMTDLGSIPHTLDEITVGSADRIRLTNPRAVFVVGCEEGVFPAVISDNGILSSSDRRELEDLDLHLSSNISIKACEERFIAYSALTQAREKLFISYHKTDGTSGYAPSIIYENTLKLFKDSIKVLDTDDIDCEYYAETPQSAFSIYAQNYSLLAVEEEAVKLNSIRSSISDIDEFSRKFQALDRAANKKDFRIEDPYIATDLFGKDMYLSASRVDVYHKCAFEYFCKHGIKALPGKKAQLSPAVSGTVIHFVLEKVIKELGKDKLIALTNEQIAEIVNKWLTIYLNENIGGFDNKTLRFKYLYNRLSISLCDVLKRLCEEFKNSEFIPCDFELPIDDNAAKDGTGVPSYTLELQDGGKLELHGSVDRVDKYEKDGTTYIRVVDYKSGGKDFVLSDVIYGLNMQMLIYLFAIQAGGQERYGHVQPSGILYYPAKRNQVSLSSKKAKEEEILKDKRKHDRGNGLFLLDEDVLNAMEIGIGGHFIPVEVKDKKGVSTITGNLITAQRLGRLRNRIDLILREMAENLHSGYISAIPAFGEDYKYTCDYCDYKTVCGFEDGKRREVKKISNDEVFELLDTEVINDVSQELDS